MKKFVSILMITIVFMILCTSCDPTVDNRDKGGDPPLPPVPTYPIELTTYEEFMSAVNDMGGKDELWGTANLNNGGFKRANSRSNFESFFKEANFNSITQVARVSANVIEISFTSGWRVLLFVDTVEGEAEASTYANGGADPKVLDTYEKYTSAIEAIKKADTSGYITVGYATKNTDWGYDGSSYDTPEFYATVKKAVMFDEYSLKLEMKGGDKYFYIINSEHCDNAMADATAMWNELKKQNSSK